MKELLRFLDQNQRGTHVSAPVARGIRTAIAASGNDCNCDHCQCDCHECAGGDTTDDR